MDYKEVDFGIEIDGKKLIFADRNVGANSVTDYGDYFTWGETEPTKIYDKHKNKWCSDNNEYIYTKYCNKDKKTILDLNDDAVHVNMGDSWRMPTIKELEILVNNANIKVNWINNYKQSNVCGLLFKCGDQELFIPPTGLIYNGRLLWSGISGFIWSSEISWVGVYNGYINANQLNIESPFFMKNHIYDYRITSNSRIFGCSVRGVKLV